MIQQASLQIGVAPFFQTSLAPAQRVQSEKLQANANVNWNEGVSLFRIPDHLRNRWWNTSAEELLGGASVRPGFEKFLKSFRAFAEFKGLPAADGFDVIVRSPGAPASDIEATAFVNLGDEATFVLVEGEKVKLEVGDGLWAPENVSLRAAATEGKADLDVLLKITVV